MSKPPRPPRACVILCTYNIQNSVTARIEKFLSATPLKDKVKIRIRTIRKIFMLNF